MKWPKHQLNIISKLQCFLGISDENSTKNISGMVRHAMILVTSWIALAMIFMPSMLYGQTSPELDEAVYEATSNIAYIMMGPSNSVVSIDLDKKEVVGSLPAEGNPHGGALTPDGNSIYAASMNTERMRVVDTKSSEVIEEIDLGAISHHTAIRLDGRYVYAAADELKVIDTVTNEVVESIKTPDPPFYPVMSPDGSTLYVLSSGTSISVIDAETHTLTNKIEMGSKSMMGHLALTSDGETLIATNDMKDKLSIIDVSSGQLRSTIPIGKQPHGVAVSADDKHAFVSKRSGSLSVVDIKSEIIIETLDLQGQPEHLTITPGGDYVLVGLKNRFQGEEVDRRGSENLTDAIAIIDTESLEIIEEIPVWSQVHDIMVLSN